jgi:hypothetical protein
MSTSSDGNIHTNFDTKFSNDNYTPLGNFNQNAMADYKRREVILFGGIEVFGNIKEQKILPIETREKNTIDQEPFHSSNNRRLDDSRNIFTLFTFINKNNIITRKKYQIDTPYGGFENLKYFVIPCLYKHVSELQNKISSFIIKGCEMFSHCGIITDIDKNTYNITGTISNETYRQRRFKLVIDECKDKLSAMTNTNIVSPFVKIGENHDIKFKLLTSTNEENLKFHPLRISEIITKFRDSDGNSIQYDRLMDNSFKFTPTFCISEIYISPFVKKLNIELIEATVTNICPLIISIPLLIKNNNDISENEDENEDENISMECNIS